jgi:hypothetical protein
MMDVTSADIPAPRVEGPLTLSAAMRNLGCVGSPVTFDPR